MLLGALIAAPTQKIIDFQLQRCLEHLARSLPDHPLEHIVRSGDRCGGRQNLIVFGHGVTFLQFARRQPGTLVDATGRLRRFSHRLGLEPATISTGFYSSSSIRPVIHSVYGLDDIVQAHVSIEAGGGRGKRVLRHPGV